MPRIGIVSGLVEEAESFRPGKGRTSRSTPYYCREDVDGRWMVGCAGLGKVNAAMVASEMIANGCDLLIGMGAAGRIGGGADGVYWIEGAYQHDYGSFRADKFVAFRAGSLPFGDDPALAFRPIDNPGLELPVATVLTGDCFIEDRAKGAELAAEFSAELVDMETGAIAQVAAMHGVGWASIRAVSGAVDREVLDSFKANLVRASAKAGREVERLVDLLLPA